VAILLDGTDCRKPSDTNALQEGILDYFFDSEMVAEVLQLGFLDRDAMDYQALLSAASEQYRAARSRQGR
jgi:hypothetical protein